MNEVMNKDSITSLELLEQINIFRKQEGKTSQKHCNLIRSIEDEFCEEITELKIESSQYKDKSGKMNKMYVLTLPQAKQVLVRESKFVRKAVIHYIEELEKMLQSQVPQLSAEDRAIVEIIHQVKAGNVPQAVGTVLEYGQEKYDEGYDKGQNDKVEELQPVIEFAEVMEKAGGKMLVREAAKMVYTKDRIEVGERKLHAVLRHWGWELFGSTTTEPSQNAIKAGWLIAKPITRYNRDEDRYHITYTPYVTAKGLTLITKKLLTMTIDEVEQIYKDDKNKMKKIKSKSQ